MKTLKEVKDRIVELHSGGDFLSSFVLQAMYIESFIRAYTEAKLKTSIGGRDIDSKLTDKLLDDIGGEKRKAQSVLDFLQSVGWLDGVEKSNLKKYFDFRNTVLHKLAKEIRNITFVEAIKEHYKLGAKIISSRVFLLLDPILTVLDESRSIYGHGKIFGGSELSDEEIYKVLELSLEGKSDESIARTLGIESILIKQIIKNKLATTVQIRVSLKGYKKKSRVENRDHVFKELDRELGVMDTEIMGSSRRANIVFARHVCMYLLNKKIKYSTVAVEGLLNRDHTTVISGVKRLEQLIASGRVRIIVDIDS